jgi:hypothetical protein
MVMAWGTPQQANDGPIASAWMYNYPLDPDLTDSYLVATVFPPLGITKVSLTLTDNSGVSATWKWGVGDKSSKKPILQESWNLILLNMNAVIYGAGAAYPDDVSYIPQLLGKYVDKKSVTKMAFSEVYKGSILTGPVITPPAQGSTKVAWNSWRELYVTKDPHISPSTSGYVVISQTPYYTPETACFWGWDETSAYHSVYPPKQQLLADDFYCINYASKLAITKIRWWGSFEGWTKKNPPQDPSDKPAEFIISIWTHEPTGGWQHPKEKTEWEYPCNPNPIYKGWARDPHSTSKVATIGDTCYEFSCEIPEGQQWIREGGPPKRYWLSIRAVYNDPSPPSHIWGWKTRPRFGSDPSAVRITAVKKGTYYPWPPEKNSTWVSGSRVVFPQAIAWNLAFEVIGEQLQP